GVVEAPLDRGEREGRVVLAAREPLLLHGADGNAVDDERRGGVVVVRGDAEDLHVSTGASSIPGCAPARSRSSRPARATRRAWPARRTREGRRSTGSSERVRRS